MRHPADRHSVAPDPKARRQDMAAKRAIFQEVEETTLTADLRGLGPSQTPHGMLRVEPQVDLQEKDKKEEASAS